MGNWNQKHLDKVAEISKRYANDASIPESARMLFAEAFTTAKSLELQVRTGSVEQVFTLLCVAANDAGFCKCNKLGCCFSTCELVRNS